MTVQEMLIRGRLEPFVGKKLEEIKKLNEENGVGYSKGYLDGMMDGVAWAMDYWLNLVKEAKDEVSKAGGNSKGSSGTVPKKE